MHKIQLRAALLRNWTTKDAAAVLQHEINFLRGDLLRSDDEIAFVLTILIINYDDEFALAKVF